MCRPEDAWPADRPLLAGVSCPRGFLHSGFVRAAAAHPQRTAVLGVDRTLTYGELDGRSNQLDRWLRAHGAVPGGLVGVVMEKGWEQIAAALGVWPR